MQILSSNTKKKDGQTLLDELVHYKILSQYLSAQLCYMVIESKELSEESFDTIADGFDEFKKEYIREEYSNYEAIIKSFIKPRKPQKYE